MSESLGARTQLDRVIPFRGYLAIGFGVVIGVGWVVYAGQWVMGGGTLGAILAFIIGGAILIPIGKCYAELTAAFPVTGGEVAFSYKAFGPTASFLTAWALSMHYVAVTPFETIATGAMFEALFPGLVTQPLYHVGGYPIGWSSILPGMAAGAWVIWLNWRGALGMARFQTLMTVGLLACTAVFVVLAVTNGSVENFLPLFAERGNAWAIAPASIASVLVVVPFFLAGFDTIPQAAEESGMEMQPRQLGVAIISTIVIGVAFYVIILAALGISVPREELAGFVANKETLPMAEVFRQSFGYGWAAQLVLFAALLGILSTLNGIFMAATRLLFAQGRGGLLPAWFGQVHPLHHTPSNAIKFVGVIALLGPLAGKAGLLVIVSAGSLVFGGVMLVTALATWRLKRIAPDQPRPYSTSKLTVLVAIAMALFLVGLMTIPGSPGQVGKAEFIVVTVWLLAGGAFFAHRQRTDSMSRAEQEHMILGEHAQ